MFNASKSNYADCVITAVEARQLIAT